MISLEKSVRRPNASFAVYFLARIINMTKMTITTIDPIVTIKEIIVMISQGSIVVVVDGSRTITTTVSVAKFPDSSNTIIVNKNVP
jgi:hypothetical protein